MSRYATPSRRASARAIVDFAAEYGGERPLVLALGFAAIVAVLFTSLSGLGGIIMVTGVLAVSLKFLYPFVDRWLQRRQLEAIDPEVLNDMGSEMGRQECVG